MFSNYFNVLILKIIFKKIKIYYFNIFLNKKYLKKLVSHISFYHCSASIYVTFFTNRYSTVAVSWLNNQIQIHKDIQARLFAEK